MKKLVALAVVTFGLMIGANSASAAYPPDNPTISTPASVVAGGSFSAVISGLPAGDTVTLTFNGKTETKTVSAPAGAAPTGNGSVTFDLTAPSKPGDYPLSATSASGWKFDATIKVIASGGGDVGDKNTTPGGKLPATGSNLVTPGLGLGLAAVAGGLGLLVVSKRRRAVAA